MKNWIKLSVLILALMLASTCTACTKPQIAQPPSTDSRVMESIPTKPPVTEADPGESQAAKPPVTAPPATKPPETEPPETEPPVTEPPATQPPHVHAYQTAVKKPTCTEGGYTTYTCSCGDSYQDDYTNAKGHVYVDTVVEPTTTQQGYTQHACHCGHAYVDSCVAPIEEEFPFTESELAAAVIRYINEHRKAEGAPELTPQVGMGNVAQYRSVQLLTNYAHDVKDKREALAYYQYGRYIDMTQYGFDESYNYYEADTQEAIGQFAAVKKTVEETAKRIALAFSNSPAHWSYLADPENKYIGVGCSKDQYDWYICIMVSEITYG